MDALRQLWIAVDEGGFDSCWAFDHFAPMGGSRSGDIFEAWTVLAAMAEATRQVRIGTMVTGNIYRHPGILAKMAATVDHVSGGRLAMGIGAGGDDYADTMLGLPSYPIRERIERLAETCQILTLLWTQPTVTFAGRFYHLEEALSDPKPLQHPHPPLWIGSSGERYGLRVVAKHADVWVNATMSPDLGELSRLSRILDRHCEDVGRDPATIRRALQFPAPTDDGETIRAVESYVGAGFTDIVFMPIYGGLRRVEELVALLPTLRALG
jgi:alkanesulfonate monooxygenase SsuD/methylene tetrahydromethanopterin reductase-like flavin-dependent oxidoreductase (luciferase family)